jgi:hypothetical protein
MLDIVSPTKLDTGRSAITSKTSWFELEGPEITLVHKSDPEDSITIVVDSGSAVVAWLSAHEHIYPNDARPGQAWTKVVVDATAAVLRSEYEVEDQYRGERLIRTRVLDVTDSPPRVVSTTGNALALLPWGSRRTVRRRVDFGVRGGRD